jgi:hypothetical protein
MANEMNVHGDHVEITLSGELTFSSYKEFQEVMKSATDAGKKSCIIDLSLGVPQGPVKTVLEHTKINEVIPIVV